MAGYPLEIKGKYSPCKKNKRAFTTEYTASSQARKNIAERTRIPKSPVHAFVYD
jgi:hypothetical protein